MTLSNVADRGRDAVDELELPVAKVFAAAERLSVCGDPHVLFTSLVRECVPLLGDACELRLTSDAGEQLHIPRLTPATPRTARQSITLPITVPAVDCASPALPGLWGSLSICFDGGPPTSAHKLAVQYLLDRALGILGRERELAASQALRERVANLSVAVETNREIGIALGIVMYQTKLSSEQAFDLLRRTSQVTHRKIRDIAADIAETGALTLPPGVALIRPRPGRRPGPPPSGL